MTILARIKRAVLAGRFELSEKARIEMFRDGLLEQDLVEAISNAIRIQKLFVPPAPSATAPANISTSLLAPIFKISASIPRENS
jgi:hypothetical protein